MKAFFLTFSRIGMCFFQVEIACRKELSFTYRQTVRATVFVADEGILQCSVNSVSKNQLHKIVTGSG